MQKTVRIEDFGGVQMIVTAIEQQKKDKSRYNIFVDGVFAFGLVMEDIVYFKLKEGSEIKEDTFQYIQETVMYIKAQDKALHYLGSKKRTEKEIVIKLQDSNFEESIIERVLEFLRKYGYVDDLDYAQSYIRQTKKLNPKGKTAVSHKLRALGICQAIIEEALEEEPLEEYDSARGMIEKKLGMAQRISYKEKKRIQDFLLRRGFSYGIIEDIFKDLEIEIEREEFD